MGAKEFMDNINDDNFSDARDELKTFVEDNIKTRIDAKQQELGFTMPTVTEQEGEGEGGEE